jgi:hypothetical protein
VENERKKLLAIARTREGFFEKKAGQKRRSFGFKPRVSFDRWGDTGNVLFSC